MNEWVCETCSFWDGHHCCIKAPTVVALTDRVWSGWPLTKADEGCGEWQLNQPMLPEPKESHMRKEIP